MATNMLRGPSLKSSSLLRTVYLLQIMILTISGEKGCYLENFNSESGKSMICGRYTVLSRLKLFRDRPPSILVPILTPCRPLLRIFPILVLLKSSKFHPFGPHKATL